jgi:hypothetical protein
MHLKEKYHQALKVKKVTLNKSIKKMIVFKTRKGKDHCQLFLNEKTP